MTSSRDPDLLVRAFIEEGIEELPNRSYDVVRASIEDTRQRVVIGPWRIEQVTKYATYGIAAVVVVLITVLGIQLLPRNDGLVGPGATATPSPTAVVTPAQTPSVVPTVGASPRALAGGSNVPLAAGRYVINDPQLTRVPVAFTLPGGWASFDAQGVAKGASNTDFEAGKAWFAAYIVDTVYGDACDWIGTMVKDLDTRQEIIDALASQENRESTAPTEVTLGGRSASRITLSVPADFDKSACDQGFMRSWPDTGGDQSGGWPTMPGEVQDVYVVDTGSGPAVVFTATEASASEVDIAEAQAILQSVEFLGD